jgi:hypothetical protein
VLSGDLCIGTGTGHGWLPVGTHYKITQTRGLWIRQIDGKLPSEVYATTFGCGKRLARPWKICSQPTGTAIQPWHSYLSIRPGSQSL